MNEIGNCRHICIDAQRISAEDTEWQVPWMKRILRRLDELSQRDVERTIFSRFIRPHRAGDAARDRRYCCPISRHRVEGWKTNHAVFSARADKALCSMDITFLSPYVLP